MLKVSCEALLRGRRLSLADCFRQELVIVSLALRDGDFQEEVRAYLIDKDRRPNWRPEKLEEIGLERVCQFFLDPWEKADHPLARLANDGLETRAE